MNFKLKNKIEATTDLLVVPIFAEYLKKLPAKLPTIVQGFIATAIKNESFKAAFGEIFFTHLQEQNLPKKLLLIGAGSKTKFSENKARVFGAKIAKFIKPSKDDSMSFLLFPQLEKYTEELAEGLLLAQYDVGKLKVKTKKKTNSLRKIEFICDGDSKKMAAKFLKAQNIAEAVELIKDLVNFPSNIVDNDYMARVAAKIADENKYKITILGKKELTKMGWGGLLAVNQGSAREPRCIVMEYSGAANPKEKPLVIIGKGVIFDTGGYNIKITGSIETMHQDMAGAATVFGLMSLLKKLGIKKNVIGITPIVENLISAHAYRPSDILTMLSGHTVEITNTDGEGRLILADAITYGQRFDPQYMISIATLTGAVSAALGDRYAGILGNAPELNKWLLKAGNQVDELVWELPIHPDFKRRLNSNVADFRNRDPGTFRLAGTAKGAAFLGKFYGKNKWCHIDIGGTAFTSDPQEFQTMGATAHGLRLLLKFLENF
ncbi:leucyl aminopeptidase [Candidatus Peregrinibacteria bacterium]|nr:leucyl aminopeptidase [Candidatus Peregrinibacteria bacterium]